MQQPPRVVVVGGGISGLATAYFLARPAGPSGPRVTLIESADRLGGKIDTSPLDGRPADFGPDALLVRSPRIRALLDEVGLAGSVVAPGSGGSYIWSRGRLRPLPAGTVFGVPGRLLPLLRSGLLSPTGFLRAGADLVLPRRPLPGDPSVGELLRPRFGREVFDRLIEPLLGGVHAGRAGTLSARSTLPEIEAVARRGRSLYLGLRRRSSRPAPGAPSAPAGPALVGLDGGMASLAGALIARMPTVDVRTGTRVAAVTPLPGGGYRLRLDGGDAVTADAVVLATPAYDAADLLADPAPAAAEALREVVYADVASVIGEYDPTTIGHPMHGTGFLVPPEEGRLLVGCTWLSRKWSYLAGGATVPIRCLVGRYGDARTVPTDDETLLREVHGELAEAMAVTAPPVRVHVRRWPRALPQYTVGHADRLARIGTALAAAPGLRVTGAAYRGVGMASCIAHAETTAQEILAELAGPATARSAARDAVAARDGGVR